MIGGQVVTATCIVRSLLGNEQLWVPGAVAQGQKHHAVLCPGRGELRPLSAVTAFVLL